MRSRYERVGDNIALSRYHFAFRQEIDLDGDQISRLIMAPQMNRFVLHPRLAADTIALGRLRLSLLLMMNDASYPWFILVPERMEAREIFELEETDRLALTEEVALLSRALWEVFRPDKLNVAALGNLVPQLHVHVIARFRSDAAWPAPVWGKADARPYAEAALRTMRARMADRLGGVLLPAH